MPVLSLAEKNEAEKNALKNHSRAYKEFLKTRGKIGKNLEKLTSAIAYKIKMPQWYLLRAQMYRVFGRNQLAFCDYNTVLRLEKNCNRCYALLVDIWPYALLPPSCSF